MYTLPTDIEELQTLVRHLLDENAALQARVAELEARLKADSHNSHKPPASDGFRKRPALPKVPGQKRGGQRGHVGKTLKRVAHPDVTVRCSPSRCSCGAYLEAVQATVIESRQVFDLSEAVLKVFLTICSGAVRGEG